MIFYPELFCPYPPFLALQRHQLPRQSAKKALFEKNQKVWALGNLLINDIKKCQVLYQARVIGTTHQRVDSYYFHLTMHI